MEWEHIDICGQITPPPLGLERVAVDNKIRVGENWNWGSGWGLFGIRVGVGVC